MATRMLRKTMLKVLLNVGEDSYQKLLLLAVTAEV